MKSLYRSATFAASAVASLWAFSQAASAATVNNINVDVLSSNPPAGTQAPVLPVLTPSSMTGNFTLSHQGDDNLVALSPYRFNTGFNANSTDPALNPPYSVAGSLGLGGTTNCSGGACFPTTGGAPNGTLTYTSPAGGASTVDILWGSPSPNNQANFFNTSGGLIGTVTGASLPGSNPNIGVEQAGFDLVAFSAASGVPIGSVQIQNTGAGGNGSPFEFGLTLNPVPVPPALYLFGSAVAGAFWLARRKRSADSPASAVA